MQAKLDTAEDESHHFMPHKASLCSCFYLGQQKIIVHTF